MAAERAAERAAGRSGFGWVGTAMILALFAQGVSIAKADPSALVLSVAGTTVPPVKLNDELDERAAIRVRPGTKLVILHYRTCKEITVTAGVLNVPLDTFSVDGARPPEEQRVTCPREQKLISEENFINNSTFYREQRAASTLTAARDFRPVSLPLRMNAVLVGGRADRVTGMDVLLNDELVTHLVVDGRKVTSSEDSLSLRPAKSYVLRVTLSGAATPLDFPFLAVDAGSSDAGLTILRID